VNISRAHQSQPDVTVIIAPVRLFGQNQPYKPGWDYAYSHRCIDCSRLIPGHRSSARICGSARTPNQAQDLKEGRTFPSSRDDSAYQGTAFTLPGRFA